MTPPPRLGLGFGLSAHPRVVAGGFSFTDSDAEAYVAALETAGATPTDDQKSAIDTFYATGKSEGWYSSLKRVYLPAWGAAAPNAVDMIGLGSGTFYGSVTHAAGYVQGDGSTGYFDTGDSSAAKGLTTSSGSMGALMYDAGLDVEWLMGRITSSISRSGLYQSSTHIINNYNTSSTSSESRSPSSGILLFSRDSGDRSFYERDSSGFSTVGSTTGADAGTVPNGNDFLMCVNNNGTPAGYTNVQLGAAFWGGGLDVTESTNFTAALQTLWETCTGLTLP